MLHERVRGSGKPIENVRQASDLTGFFAIFS